VADGFDVVAVRVQDEGAVVVLVVVGAQAGRAVAFDQELVAERVQRLPVECLALLQVADPQANMVDHQPLPSSPCGWAA